MRPKKHWDVYEYLPPHGVEKRILEMKEHGYRWLSTHAQAEFEATYPANPLAIEWPEGMHVVLFKKATSVPTIDLSFITEYSKRPLVCIDVETTGLHPYHDDGKPGKDRVIEIAIARFMGIGQIDKFDTLINPGIPIPPEATEINGITDEMVQAYDFFGAYGPTIEDMIMDADVIAYNADFDIEFIDMEFALSARESPFSPETQILDPLMIYLRQVPHTLENAFNFYVKGGSDPTAASSALDPHRAMDDVWATLAILQYQLLHEEIGGTPKDIIEYFMEPYLDTGHHFMKNGEGKVEVCFGKHKGKGLFWVFMNDPKYIDWMKKEFGKEVIRILKGFESQIETYKEAKNIA